MTARAAAARVAVALAVSVLAAACGDGGKPASTVPTTRYANAERGFTLDLPRDWKVHEEGVAGKPNEFHVLDAVPADAEKRGGLNLTVFSVPAPEGATLDALVFGNLESLRRNRKGVEVRDQKRRDVNGVPQHRVLLRADAASGQQGMLIFSSLHGGRLYAFTFSAAQSEFGAAVPACDVIAGSVRFGK